jgi:hypothetical protein
MKPVHVETVSCFECSSKRLCCLCAPLWFRVKNRNYCNSCHQLKWTKAVIDFSYVHIYEGIVENFPSPFKEAITWSVFQKFVFAPKELSVGEFKGLYFGANLARLLALLHMGSTHLHNANSSVQLCNSDLRIPSLCSECSELPRHRSSSVDEGVVTYSYCYDCYLSILAATVAEKLSFLELNF